MARSSPGDHFIDLNLLPVSLHIGHFHGEMRSWGFIALERGRWRNYLHTHSFFEVSLRDVAAQVHLSKRHINRVFHRKMGISIMEYLTSVRMDHAAHLLLERHRPTKEVAHAVGYPDVRYFITVFQRRMGLTPAAFRRQGARAFSALRDERPVTMPCRDVPFFNKCVPYILLSPPLVTVRLSVWRPTHSTRDRGTAC